MFIYILLFILIFQAAVLTPSKTKKWLKRRKSIKSEESFKDDKSKIEDVDKSSELSEDFCDPTLVFFIIFYYLFFHFVPIQRKFIFYLALKVIFNSSNNYLLSITYYDVYFLATQNIVLLFLSFFGASFCYSSLGTI